MTLKQEPGNKARSEFPIFANSQGKYPMCYLDTAASSQKPKNVINRITQYYEHEHANIHRGAYRLSAEATENFEKCRQRVAQFINATSSNSVVFTRGTTESINLLAHSSEILFRPGDTILLSLLEHHSNIVPWQMLAARKKLKLEFIDIQADGTLDLNDFKEKISNLKPKLCSITHTSNALGTVVPLNFIREITKAADCLLMIDAAQAAAHSKLDVQLLDADFLAFSGHKVYGPTGVGILYIKESLLDNLTPFMGGGDMIETVACEGSTWAKAPQKFEAGTPAIAEILALHAAIDFIDNFSVNSIVAHDHQLLGIAIEELRKLGSVSLYGPNTNNIQQAGILSFNLDGIHAHDLATVADTFNVQLRAGHHCAMPLMSRLGILSSARISFGVYNTAADIEQLIEALKYAKKLLG